MVAQISAWMARAILALMGWTLYGEKPPVKKAVIIGAPHTSNFDGLLMLLVAFGLKVRLKWLVKDNLYKFPLSIVLKWVGAIPIDRSASRNAVSQAVDVFDRLDEIFLTLAPEGTRKRSEGWRTGFYYIALKANVPIYFGFADYKRKLTGIDGHIEPSGDIEADMVPIKAFYETITAKFPEQVGEIKLALRKNNS
ncbi:MAG: lysophospholipid acyltransferase family protein [Anaerolineae bacterium]|nr:lysophospholipid acyltransferase family protein [Anaerolineae bacterium]